MRDSHWVALGALAAGLGVAMGAFGAHALHDRLVEAGQLDNWHTAVRYQVWHALALVAYGLWRRATGGRSAAVGWCLLIGSAFFSGSLYAIALDVPTTYLWPVTPAGGLLLLVAWVLFAVAALRAPRA
jgi:uncharacterized membrane protein YgdD (TMEM256/DUF423 family)